MNRYSPDSSYDSVGRVVNFMKPSPEGLYCLYAERHSDLPRDAIENVCNAAQTIADDIEATKPGTHKTLQDDIAQLRALLGE